MDRIFRPAKPSSPQLEEVGAKAGFWSEDLKQFSKPPKVSENKGSTSEAKEKRAKVIAEDESKRGEARKKGELAYLTVTVVRESTIRFQ
ncbi:hypothetical protein ACJA88_013756 [Fusarium oxysporum]|uniref:Uncharacterized protein n=1 Tax=Fusarium oxysporum Fo47 TaxID=660027 RepID=W9K475_FUSOX|nr:hypothetical protein FOZG_09533 [Fusarium oxysporum Fo47]KAH7481596.1 hypothetical protein FOMA001_g8234 [Fusarium oxysporum f. sp. matthiolae]